MENNQSLRSDSNLVWLDLEMTGLDISKDVIIEIAVLITDNNANVIAQGPDLAIYQSDEILDTMDDWNKKQHRKSGLVERVKNSKIDIFEAEDQVLEFISQYVNFQKSPLCGNTIYQDRIFLRKYMPRLENFLYYRLIDVSTIKELVRRWYPKDPKAKFDKEGKHRAMEDILGSIEELNYYKKYFFKD